MSFKREIYYRFICSSLRGDNKNAKFMCSRHGSQGKEYHWAIRLRPFYRTYYRMWGVGKSRACPGQFAHWGVHGPLSQSCAHIQPLCQRCLFIKQIMGPELSLAFTASLMDIVWCCFGIPALMEQFLSPVLMETISPEKHSVIIGPAWPSLKRSFLFIVLKDLILSIR